MNKRKASKYKVISIDENANKDILASEIMNQVVKQTIDDELIVNESIKHVRTVCFLTLIHRMGETQRIIFSLVDMFGIKTSEVSSLMKMGLPAVKSHLNRARKKLDEELSSKCGLLDVQNPCRCKAWERFVMNREERRKAVRDKEINDISGISELDKKESIDKIRKMFSEMSEFEPSKDWYKAVIKELNKIT